MLRIISGEIFAFGEHRGVIQSSAYLEHDICYLFVTLLRSCMWVIISDRRQSCNTERLKGDIYGLEEIAMHLDAGRG